MRYLPALVYTADVTTSRITTFPQEFTAVVQGVESNWSPQLEVSVPVLEDRILRGPMVYQTGKFSYQMKSIVSVNKVVALSGAISSTFTEVPVIEATDYSTREYLYDAQYGLIEQVETNNQTIIVPIQRWG